MSVYKAVEKAIPMLVLAMASVFGLSGNIGPAVAGVAIYLLFNEIDKIMKVVKS